MITEKNIISFIINLDNYEENYKKQLSYFKSINLTPKRFSAINAIDNEHIKYKNLINLLSLYLTPKSCIGCSLSHILLAKYLYKNYSTCKNIYFLILEDDVFPKNEYLNNSKKFYYDLNNEIENIKIIDKNWDIIQLHSDGPIDTKSTYTTHLFTGSTAAYLLSFNGLEKMIKEKVTYHLDFTTQNFLKYRKYRLKNNLFYTNEKSSVNREMNYSKSVLIKSVLLKKIIPLRGEKLWEDYLNFKSLRLPILNKEFTANNIIDFGLLFSIFYSFKNRNFYL